MKEYLSKVDDVLAKHQTSQNGLDSTDAQSRLEKHGKNKLAEGNKKTILQMFLSELADPMIIILIAAAVISGILAVVEGESFADVIIILAVVIINSVLGVLQESKAEKAIAALQEITAATSKVYRDGKLVVLRSEELVPGDVVELEAGDAVPADARLISCYSLKCEESALTGESVPVEKHDEPLSAGSDADVPLGDRKNMVYMGSTVVYGRGSAVITATGMDTEMGKIADAISTASENETPLQIKLNQLSKVLTFLVLGICVFIFAFNIIRSIIAGETIGFENVLNTFMVAVSLAVAAIPEGLAAVVTIVLSIGVTKMSKRNAVIRKLTAVETLGCAQIICSDKTGTLTQNKMTVVDYSGSDEKLIATGMSLCSDAKPDDSGEAVGEPTECALVNYATKLGLLKPELETKMPRVAEAPFDSMRKMMSTVHADGKGFIQFTKGAPDIVLSKCTTALVDGKTVKLTDSMLKDINAANKAMADKALRVLCVAQRTWDALPEDTTPENLEQELCYVGLTGMIDPIRPEVKIAVEQCHAAGIRAIMITGDHKDTAVAIAKDLGLIKSADEAITGLQLDEISDEELEKQIEQYSVYARVQPEHKVRIVNAWKSKGMITAMTGDGVNDAPSIKSADIGVGMGITGTDVTKNVADMVLADDNFATIVDAVGEGRRIYSNIRKSIQFLLSSNLSEVVSIFTATLLGFTILKPVHLLWINLITDCFPALALGMEDGEPDNMTKPPRKANEGFFSNGMGIDIVVQGIIVSALTIIAYFIGEYMENGVWQICDSNDGMTMAFLTLSMTEIFHSFNMRSRRASVFSLKKQNLFIWGAMALSFVLTTAVIYIPFLRDAFGFTSISFPEYAVAMVLSFTILPIIEIIKFFQRKFEKKDQ